MINIPANAQVECTDGSAGKSTAVVINPITRTLTDEMVEQILSKREIGDSEEKE